MNGRRPIFPQKKVNCKFPLALTSIVNLNNDRYFCKKAFKNAKLLAEEYQMKIDFLLFKHIFRHDLIETLRFNAAINVD